MVPLLQIEKIFCTLFTMFTPSHPCANDDTLKFFFIKMFQTFFCRIKIGCIFIGRITLKSLLFFVKFILQYVLLIFFSFALRLLNPIPNTSVIRQVSSALGQPDRHFSRNLPLVVIIIQKRTVHFPVTRTFNVVSTNTKIQGNGCMVSFNGWNNIRY